VRIGILASHEGTALAVLDTCAAGTPAARVQSAEPVLVVHALAEIAAGRLLPGVVGANRD
jgi:hypothetical protein